MAKKEKRDSWTNNFGFVMAAAGAAIGLGNIWRFPYICGENGGGAFLLVYLGCVFFIGLPILIAELLIGRKAKTGSASAFVSLIKKHKPIWKVVGMLGVLIAFLNVSYYTVVAGWTLEYLWQTITGQLAQCNAETSQACFDSFMHSDSQQISMHLIFTVITVVILLGGISGGIEKVAEFLMPVLFFILIGLTIYGLSFEASMAGQVAEKMSSIEFMFKPDWSKFTGKSFLEALGQAGFSLSIAVGTMIAYGSYLNKKENIAQLASIVVVMDTLVGLLGGMVIFPIVFAYGLNPEAGTGLIFVTLPALFNQIPGGEFLAPIFYILLFLAALTTSISLLEPAVTHIIDEFKAPRPISCYIAGTISAALGVIWVTTSSLESSSLFTNIDKVVSNLLIPIEAIAIAVFIGWFLEKKSSRSELRHIPDWIYYIFRYLCKWVCPIAITIILINGL